MDERNHSHDLDPVSRHFSHNPDEELSFIRVKPRISQGSKNNLNSQGTILARVRLADQCTQPEYVNDLSGLRQFENPRVCSPAGSAALPVPSGG